jgi:hypothetical protein
LFAQSFVFAHFLHTRQTCSRMAKKLGKHVFPPKENAKEER